MKIYYQGNTGSYMQIASQKISTELNIEITDLVGLPDFADVWSHIGENGIGVLAIENSYMGSIHQNIYSFLDYDYKIIGEYYLEIKHCLCSLENNIKDIEIAYSQAPALNQCKKYLQQKGIKEKPFGDTALSAKHLKENVIKKAGAICSVEAAKHYGLNILDTDIADQKGNTTRFIIIAPKNTNICYKQFSNKTSIIFEAKDIPASLYKCLGAFATTNINLRKIESIPSFKNSFMYYFWLEFDGKLSDSKIITALDELKVYTKNIRILGSY